MVDTKIEVFYCFKCEKTGCSDDFQVLDWETDEGDENFIYVHRSCLAATIRINRLGYLIPIPNPCWVPPTAT